ncbi:tRNA(Ile)-lysidine synthase [Natronobacillus azotifigens]|uniref:tRNA(Ile)-lysidine synthase n=1 Tax=Natronobacillus azotifigens TaxID=472978 RepID=A0A9J6RCY8_9BACI|nr:tRNA lysidine(34) synthetase TilS [Natronobacillus azotifigens]MCZ0703578.1 tRNA lysidine(34) synthetase TilS [Natronobacillus azotifigens]
MKQEVDQFIKRHQLFEPFTTLLVGVSGGPDSIALLNYLYDMKVDWGFHLVALSVDHQLRGEESQADLQYVKQYCEERSITFVGVSLDVPNYKSKHKLGTQEAARAMRYQFFEEQMKENQADYLVLGHHGDDQVETMFMRMTRGANPASLTGIPISRTFATGKLVRPFLSVTKEQIESYCSANDLVPRRDPSNHEDHYTRNYFRMHILPLLKDQNPNLHQSVQKLSENMTDDSNFLDEQARKVSDEIIQYEDDPKQVTCSIIQVKKQPYALQRRMFHLILNYLYDTLPSGLFYGHETQFFDLLHSERANVSVNLPNKLSMIKSYQNLHFQFYQKKEVDFFKTLTIPGKVMLPTGAEVHASIISSDQKTKDKEKHKDYYFFPLHNNLQESDLAIRYRLPGDRIYLQGLNGRKKVKDIFIDEKIPVYQRDDWPLVVEKTGEVLWVVGLAKGTPSGSYRLNGDRFVQMEYRRKT